LIRHKLEPMIMSRHARFLSLLPVSIDIVEVCLLSETSQDAQYMCRVGVVQSNNKKDGYHKK
jgi:hypothetical protein